jgi:hypothetical protein
VGKADHTLSTAVKGKKPPELHIHSLCIFKAYRENFASRI